MYVELSAAIEPRFNLVTLHRTDNTKDGENKHTFNKAFSFTFTYWIYPPKSAGNGVSEALNLKNFWESMLPKSPSLERCSMFSTRSETLKISRYAPALSEMILRKSEKIKRCDNQPNGNITSQNVNAYVVIMRIWWVLTEDSAQIFLMKAM